MIVLYCGSSKLYKASTSTTEFLAACVLPLPFLIYWVYKEKRKRRGQESGCVPVVNRDVLEMLHGPFRKPQGDDKRTLNRESMLIGRRFALLACQTLIHNKPDVAYGLHGQRMLSDNHSSHFEESIS